MNRKGFNKHYFDEEFYVGKSKGAIRNEDSPHYHFFTSRVIKCLLVEGLVLKDTKVLDVGCGVGWEPKHYLNAGCDAYGVDVSKWAYDNSILPSDRKYMKDIRQLDKIFYPGHFDLVVADRILAYLPNKAAISKGISQLVKVSNRFICFAIICSDHKGVKVQKWAKGSGRLSYLPKSFYEQKFKRLGLKVHKKYTEIMLGRDWDCVWFCEKERGD